MALNARSIRLDNYALLTANTQSTKIDPSSEQATININSQDLIMGGNSNIFTNATGADVIGGNINIHTDVLVALKNSDIRADAEEAFGGRVIINSQGIFGTEFRDQPTLQSDITATSELGPEFSGTVELNTPDVDPSQGVVALPEEVVDVSGLIAQTCPAGSGPRQSKFVATGRGGLPPNPGDTLSTDAVQVDLVTLKPEVDKSSTATVSTSPSRPASTPIVEAQGWVIDAKGNVVLTANAPAVNLHGSWQKTAKC